MLLGEQVQLLSVFSPQGQLRSQVEQALVLAVLGQLLLACGELQSGVCLAMLLPVVHCWPPVLPATSQTHTAPLLRFQVLFQTALQ